MDHQLSEIFERINNTSNVAKSPTLASYQRKHGFKFTESPTKLRSPAAKLDEEAVQEKARAILNSWITVEDDAANLRTKATGQESKWPQGRVRLDPPKPPVEESEESDDDEDLDRHYARAMQLVEKQRKKEARQPKTDQARRDLAREVKVREYDPTYAMNQRHDEMKAKREARLRAKTTEINERSTVESQSSRRMTETNERSSVDINIAELRNKRAQLEEEINVTKETNDQIRAQVRRETEEIRQLDMIRRRNVEETKQRDEILKEKEAVEQESKNIQKQFVEYKAKKIVDATEFVLNSDLLRIKKLFVRQLANLVFSYKTIEVKLQRKRRFRLLNRIYAAWSSYISQVKLGREEEMLRQKMEHEHKLLKIAYKHYENKIYQTCFFNWNLYISRVQREREEEREAAMRKAKIDELMNAVKEKAKKESQPPVVSNVLEVPERIPIKLRSSSRSNESSASNLSQRSMSPRSGSLPREEDSPRLKLHSPKYSIDQPPVSPVSQVNIKRNVKQQRSPGRSPRIHSNPPRLTVSAAQPNAPRQTVQAEPQQSSKRRTRKRTVTKPPPPEVTAMEQRQEERKRKRAELSKQYQEKKEAEDKQRAEREELRAADEKKKKREAYLKKKQEAGEKKKLREEKQAFIESLRTKYETARAFNNQQLLNYYGLQPMKTYLATVKRARAAAVIKGRISIQRFGIETWREAVKISIAEKEQTEYERELQATQYYLNKLKAHAFNAIIQEFIDSMNQGNEASANRNQVLLRQALQGWVSIRPDLQKEMKAQLEQECYIVHQFKLLTHGPRVLKRLKANAEGNKLSRLREKHNVDMWNKVQGWLDES